IMIDLQGLTDELCERLGRSAAVDNTHFEFVTISAQLGEIDHVREDIVMSRRTGSEVVDFIKSQGVAQATEPLVVPGSTELGSLPRWCFPIRYQDRFLGCIWLINSPELSDEEVEIAASYVAPMRDVLVSNLEHADAN